MGDVTIELLVQLVYLLAQAVTFTDSVHVGRRVAAMVRVSSHSVVPAKAAFDHLLLVVNRKEDLDLVGKAESVVDFHVAGDSVPRCCLLYLMLQVNQVLDVHGATVVDVIEAWVFPLSGLAFVLRGLLLLFGSQRHTLSRQVF